MRGKVCKLNGILLQRDIIYDESKSNLFRLNEKAGVKRRSGKHFTYDSVAQLALTEESINRNAYKDLLEDQLSLSIEGLYCQENDPIF